jgi:hypothetical protein
VIIKLHSIGVLLCFYTLGQSTACEKGMHGRSFITGDRVAKDTNIDCVTWGVPALESWSLVVS